ncbi:hypothetical protein NKG05_22035 [Oerskovia sp. M15]
MGTQESMVDLDLSALGLAPEHGQLIAHDLLTGASYGWGEHVYVRLVPQEQVAHVIHVSAP